MAYLKKKPVIIPVKLSQYTLPVCGKCRHFIFNNSTHHCQSCKECKSVCICKKRAGIGTFKVPRSQAAAIGSSSFLVYSKRAIGLEVELSNFGSWFVKEKQRGALPDGFGYMVDHDGSVRPSQLEVVMDPLAGDQQIINGLNSLAIHVWNNDCEVNETCGYHVHVDARDYTWADIQKLMFVWMKIEQTDNIWQLAGRKPTQFSQTWVSWFKDKVGEKLSQDLKLFKTQIVQALYHTNPATYKSVMQEIRKSNRFKSDYKYHLEINTQTGVPRKLMKLPRVENYCDDLVNHKALKANRGWNRAVRSRYLDLNIHSWLYRGTVEYRLAAGTTDPKDIRMWPLFCLWLTEVVNRTNFRIVLEYVRSKNDLIETIIKDKGFRVPEFGGDTIYPISP